MPRAARRSELESPASSTDETSIASLLAAMLDRHRTGLARRDCVSRVSVELLPDAPAAEVLMAIRAADESAIDTVFCVDEIYHRDAWALLAAAARETRRVRLAVGVAHVTLRDPLLVAQQLATLDELSEGRAAAAFSVGNFAMLAQFGYDLAELHPVRRLREAHRAMRSLLATGAVELDCEI